VSDTFMLEANEARWPMTFWDPAFTMPLSDTGLMESCTRVDVGARVEVPPDALAYHIDRVSLGARSQRNTLILGSAPVTTTLVATPGVAWIPDIVAGDAIGLPSVGQEAWYTLTVTNTGNVTEVFALSVSDAAWDTSFLILDDTQEVTETEPLSPFSGQAVQVRVQAPPWTYAGSSDTATLWATGRTFSGTVALATATSTAAVYPDVDWNPEVQGRDDAPGRIVPYLVEVRNRGNVDDHYRLAVLGADWQTTLWNESFTQPITQTEVLAPGEVQRVGVRVRIPAGAASPGLDAALLRAN
jgi:hypothetical protein